MLLLRSCSEEVFLYVRHGRFGGKTIFGRCTVNDRDGIGCIGRWSGFGGCRCVGGRSGLDGRLCGLAVGRTDRWSIRHTRNRKAHRLVCTKRCRVCGAFLAGWSDDTGGQRIIWRCLAVVSGMRHTGRSGSGAFAGQEKASAKREEGKMNPMDL